MLLLISVLCLHPTDYASCWQTPAAALTAEFITVRRMTVTHRPRLQRQNEGAAAQRCS